MEMEKDRSFWFFLFLHMKNAAAAKAKRAKTTTTAITAASQAGRAPVEAPATCESVGEVVACVGATVAFEIAGIRKKNMISFEFKRQEARGKRQEARGKRQDHNFERKLREHPSSGVSV